MSAFGGKAEINHQAAERPLIAINGHMAHKADPSAHSHKRKYATAPIFVRSAGFAACFADLKSDLNWL